VVFNPYLDREGKQANKTTEFQASRVGVSCLGLAASQRGNSANQLGFVEQLGVYEGLKPGI
jgi:hypothetical protein